MSLAGLNGFWQLVIFFVAFVLVQRWFHRELQRFILLFSGSKKAVLTVYSVFFFPGVLLHEGSHFLAARILGVPVKRFSLKPRVLTSGKVRLGFVETDKAGFLRNSLIGAAPLLTGGIVVALLGVYLLKFNSIITIIQAGEFAKFWSGLIESFANPIFWLGLYLAVSVSSMMLPSKSDRRDWHILIFIAASLLALLFIIGEQAWLSRFVFPHLDKAFGAMGMVFFFSFFAHIFVLLPLWLGRWGMSKISQKKRVPSQPSRVPNK